MLRRCLPESRLPAQHTCVLPQCGHIPTPKRSCWPALGVALLCVLCLAWTAPGYATSEPPGFAHNCSGFAQDPLFGPLGLARLSRKGETFHCPGNHGAALSSAWQGLGHV